MMDPRTSVKMGAAVDLRSRGNYYQGTVSPAVKAKRRAKNKVARVSRKANR